MGKSMLVCEAVVDTTRAHRYVAQLADHFAHQPGGIRAQSHDPAELLADFGFGTCSMHAQPDALLLRAEAADSENLERIRRGVAARLEQIGRRDGLAVHWGPATTG